MPQDPPIMSDDYPFLAIGIDFGTTQSGVGWALSKHPEEKFHIYSWGLYSTNEKVDTRISYDRNGKVSSWGFQEVPEGDHQFKYFKLLLSDDGTAAAKKLGDTSNDIAQMSLLKKKPVDVAADFLGCLWEHTVKYFRENEAELFAILPFKVVLTVPANWDHKAQGRTRDAAVKAGILKPLKGRRTVKSTTLDIVSEPEACALTVFGEAQKKKRFKEHDSFVVCDAGGGTVDLISYEIDRLEPSLRLNMCCEATGDTCGAVFLDRAFEERIIDIVKRPFYETFKSSPAKLKQMWVSWEHDTRVRFHYNQKPSKIPFSVPISGYRNDGTLNLSIGDLKLIFEGVCDKVKALVEKQVESVQKNTHKLPKAILLVGGFGQNQYLVGKLTHDFPGVDVIQTQYPIRAIYFGAVARGLNNETVLNHIPKCSYGFSHSIVWKDGYDSDTSEYPPGDKEENPNEPGKYVAVNRVTWYHRRGVSILHKDPVEEKFKQSFNSRAALNDHILEMFYSTSDKPRNRKSEGVKPLCKIHVNFDEKIWDKLDPQRNAKGDTCKIVEYTLGMKVTAGSLMWYVRYGDEDIAEERVDATYE